MIVDDAQGKDGKDGKDRTALGKNDICYKCFSTELTNDIEW